MHSQLPWRVMCKTKIVCPPTATSLGGVVATVTGGKHPSAIADAQYIVEACNNYKALTAERDGLQQLLDAALSNNRRVVAERVRHKMRVEHVERGMRCIVESLTFEHIDAALRIARAALAGSAPNA